MTIRTFTSREFNQGTSEAKKAALEGTVYITDRGRPTHVLLSIEEFERLTGHPRTIAEMLFMPAAADIEFEPPRSGEITRPIDLD